MFQIRQHHLDDFESSLLARVRKLVQRHVAQQHAMDLPPETAAELLSRGDTAAQAAWDFGIQDPDDVRDFVDLTIEHGDQFETQPGHVWVAEILNDAGMDGEEKIARILDGFQDQEQEGEDDLGGDDDDEEDNETAGEEAMEDEEEDELDARELLDFPEIEED